MGQDLAVKQFRLTKNLVDVLASLYSIQLGMIPIDLLEVRELTLDLHQVSAHVSIRGLLRSAIPKVTTHGTAVLIDEILADVLRDKV